MENEVVSTVSNPLVLITASSVLAFAIPFIIGLLKKFVKLSTKAAPLVAFVLGAVLGIVAHLVGLVPDLSLVQAVVLGVAIGGTSTGLYDIKKQLTKTS